MDLTNAFTSGILLLLLASHAAMWYRLGKIEGQLHRLGKIEDKMDQHLREHQARPSP